MKFGSLVILLALIACSAGTSKPVPQPTTATMAKDARAPGYLSFGFTYQKRG